MHKTPTSAMPRAVLWVSTAPLAPLFHMQGQYPATVCAVVGLKDIQTQYCGP